MLSILEKQVEELELLASDIEKHAEYLFKRAPVASRFVSENEYINVPYYELYWIVPDDNLKKLQERLIMDYQMWFSSSHHLVKEYLPDRENEFTDLYGGTTGIITRLELRGPRFILISKIIYEWKRDFLIQRSILSSIPPLAKIKEKTLRKILTSDLVNSEIEEAEFLFEKHHRAAGAVAGVALERYLKTLCDINNISYKNNGIKSLAQLLYQNKPSKLDNTELSNMEFLGKIRNQCTHPSSPNDPDYISDDELKRRVRILIDQTKGYVQKL